MVWTIKIQIDKTFILYDCVSVIHVQKGISYFVDCFLFQHKEQHNRIDTAKTVRQKVNRALKEKKNNTRNMNNIL